MESVDKRLLVFVVAYNAEKTIESVLSRIPRGELPADTDVLVIDDSSADNTFDKAKERAKGLDSVPIKVLYNPVNQGYGGNQKLGYQYAIDKGYDCVVLLHGDGQYAPERLPSIVAPILDGEADACFGSRMLEEGGARRGGMPLYKYLGNKILSSFQNRTLKTRLSEFHSGYRAYAVDALRKLPFQRNSNDFHFDTEIIIQLIAGQLRIMEVPIPTYYGDEICYVNGLKYAWNVVAATVKYRFHMAGLLHQPQYDVEGPDTVYETKDQFFSSHSLAINSVAEDSKVLDIAGGIGHVAEKLRHKGCNVTGIDKRDFATHRYDRFICHDVGDGALPEGLGKFDSILLLDCLEHFAEPEALLSSIRKNLYRPGAKVIVSVPNIGFIVTRLALLGGQFNYGRRGILDRTHVRLFTFQSLKRMLVQEGFVIRKVKGVPAPFPLAAGKGVGGGLLWLNRAFIMLWRNIFAYQVYIEAEMLPPVTSLLETTLAYSEDLGHTGQK